MLMSHNADSEHSWTSQEALIRHHGRDWLQEMYRAFEAEQLLVEPGQIEYLSLISGFAARYVEI